MSTGTNVAKLDGVVNTPTTIEGYGITNAYNKNEVDYKIDNIEYANIVCQNDEING